jgi:hypothetical protein
MSRQNDERALQPVTAAENDPLVDGLAEAILDGSPIDWVAAESSSDGTAQPIVAQLSVLAAVAAFARGEAADAPVLWGDPAAARTQVNRGVLRWL